MDTMSDTVFGYPVVNITTWFAFASVLIAGAFMARYATKGWWRSAEGRIVMILVTIVTLFGVRAFILRYFGPFMGSEWVSLGLYVPLVALLVYLHFVFTKAQRRKPGGKP